MDGLGNYVIQPGAIEQVMGMENNPIKFDYTYTKRSLKRAPDIFYTLTYLGSISTRNYSRIAWDMYPQGRYQPINLLRPSTELIGTNKQ